MFHPNDNPLDRGWVGRIDGDRMLHLAAQTLQSFFLVGGGSRVHAEYPLADVTLLVPVQYPPTVRLFDDSGSFRFANATAVVGPNVPVAGTGLSAWARIAVVIGAGGEIGGTTAMVEWHDPAEQPGVKQSDFGIVLGPVVVTPDEIGRGLARLPADAPASGAPRARAAPFAWAEALALAGRRTTLRPGDVIAGPSGRRARRDRRRRGARGRRHRHARMPARVMRLVLDWDGTITERDTLHMAIEEFGDVDVFHALEAQIGRELTLNEVIGVEMATISAPFDVVLDWLLDTVVVRPGLPELVDGARSAHHLGRVPRADRARARARGRRRHASSRTASRPTRRDGARRSSSARPARCAASPASASPSRAPEPYVYVGDGISDRCASLAAERVFARSGLAQYLAAQGVAYEPFETLHDVREALERCRP